MLKNIIMVPTVILYTDLLVLLLGEQTICANCVLSSINKHRELDIYVQDIMCAL